MLIFDGKTYREATAEEVAEFERIAKEEEEARKKLPLSDSEALSILLGGDTEC